MQPTDDPDRAALAESAELLRIVLPKMREHADGYAPASYAIWYEYVKGGMPKLVHDVDAAVATRGRLTAVETRSIFDAHLRDQSERAFVAARSRFATMLTRMRSSMDAAAVSGDAFDHILREFGEALDATEPVAGVADAMARVGAGTNRFRQSVRALSGELESNRAEVDRLTQELDRLREDASTDPLTGLANRRGFEAALAALAGANGSALAHDGGTHRRPFSLVMVDIDHFKRVNDGHGHLVGDRVLQQVATTIRSCIRGGDLCARFGGEEFVLLLPDTTPAGAQTVIDHVRNAMRRMPMPMARSGSPLPAVTISAGVAGWTSAETIETCIHRADEALYESKRNGRDRVTLAA